MRLTMNDKVDSKIYTLITCAPSGTLGDVTSCKKYIEETLAALSKKQDSASEVIFNLVITDVYNEKTKAQIEAVLKDNPLYTYNISFVGREFGVFSNDKSIKRSDAFIFYPSFQITPDKLIQLLKQLLRPWRGKQVKIQEYQKTSKHMKAHEEEH